MPQYIAEVTYRTHVKSAVNSGRKVVCVVIYFLTGICVAAAGLCCGSVMVVLKLYTEYFKDVSARARQGKG